MILKFLSFLATTHSLIFLTIDSVEINSLLSKWPHLFLSIWSSKCTAVIPNSSKVSIVSLHDLNPVSISTIVGRLVTLEIKYDRVLTSCKVVKPISGNPRSLAITPPET